MNDKVGKEHSSSPVRLTIKTAPVARNVVQNTPLLQYDSARCKLPESSKLLNFYHFNSTLFFTLLNNNSTILNMSNIKQNESMNRITNKSQLIPGRTQRPEHPLLSLDQENLEFVLQLVLASGSLKELARYYGISYPTVRARLDKLIVRLQLIVESRERDEMANLLANLVEASQLTSTAAQSILELHRSNH
ncbi:hypothetical protein Pan241w_39540 [Gimesia alba]|uniref:DUF2089 domain-containing protein n=2 Tax=Gimesia alba TaxID=2527973 RepID=A0A517RJ07_9PLAN|nr:hypothetical protein Pan241w_39540 [Gimesia alba]